mgnify:CR=1 FL=1
MTKETLIDTEKLPTVHTPTVTTVPRPPRVHRGGAWKIIGVVFFCFVASFLGSWAAVQSGLITVNGTNTTTERRRVIEEGNVVSEVAKEVSPSVVSIVTESTARSYFGASQQQSAGTGIIISKNGYILTNRHVIPDTATKVQVVLSDGTQYDDVKVVGRDSLNDLAFLKISGVDSLTPAKLGDSGDMQVGAKVIAIGNALGQYQTTVTSGIISAIGRPLTASDESGESAEQLENLLQTDAAINPGNSGGPLVNIAGEVIGINTAVAQEAQGIGFAIPVNDAKGLIKSVVETGSLKRAYLGVRYLSITPDVVSQLNLPVKNGAYVTDSNSAVVSGSPADKAGVRPKDIITKVNTVAIDARHPLSSQLSQYVPGDTVTLTVLRDGKTIELKATLTQYDQ